MQQKEERRLRLVEMHVCNVPKMYVVLKRESEKGRVLCSAECVNVAVRVIKTSIHLQAA